MKFSLNVNGKRHQVDVEADTPLLWVLRDELGLTGTKFGCGIAACGACSVHLDGAVMRSCSIAVEDAAGSKITTIEGLANAENNIPNGTEGPLLSKLQLAWVEHQVPQCGYCQSGMLMAVSALLKEKPFPSDDDIDDVLTNICRCGTYTRVRRAIHAVAQG